MIEITKLEKSLEPWCAEYLTTGAVAQYCGVTKVTVLRWIQKELLAAFKLPGGHNRIHRDNFDEFLMKYEIPVHRRMVENQ